MKSYMFWNCRGIAGHNTVDRIELLTKMHRISILAIIEAKVSEHQINKYRVLLGFQQVFGNGKDIWVFVSKEATASVISASLQVVTIVVNPSSSPVFVSAVHGHVNKTQRRELWDTLLALNLEDKLWIIGGDFNTVCAPAERKGGLPADGGSIFEFNQFILDAFLSQVNFLMSRLDRVLANHHWFSRTSSNHVTHLSLVAWSRTTALSYCSFLLVTNPAKELSISLIFGPSIQNFLTSSRALGRRIHTLTR